MGLKKKYRVMSNQKLIWTTQVLWRGCLRWVPLPTNLASLPPPPKFSTPWLFASNKSQELPWRKEWETWSGTKRGGWSSDWQEDQGGERTICLWFDSFFFSPWRLENIMHAILNQVNMDDVMLSISHNLFFSWRWSSIFFSIEHLRSLLKINHESDRFISFLPLFFFFFLSGILSTFFASVFSAGAVSAAIVTTRLAPSTFISTTSSTPAPCQAHFPCTRGTISPGKSRWIYRSNTELSGTVILRS